MNLRISSIGFQLLILGLWDAQAQITYEQADAEAMVQNLLALSGGATAENIVLTGNPNCAGLFSQGTDAVPGLDPPFPDSGIVLSTGNPADLHGQHSDYQTTSWGAPGDGDLDAIVGGSTNEQAGMTVIVEDQGSGTEFGPYSSGTNIKYVEAPGGRPRERPGPGVVDYMLTGNGDALVRVTDGAGNTAVASCLVPPHPSRRHLRRGN